MKIFGLVLLIITLAACVAVRNSDGPQKPLNPVTEAVPQKSPHGYVVGGNPGRFGGFIGDCTSEENFPHYWECQAENAGNGFH